MSHHLIEEAEERLFDAVMNRSDKSQTPSKSKTVTMSVPVGEPIHTVYAMVGDKKIKLYEGHDIPVIHVCRVSLGMGES